MGCLFKSLIILRVFVFIFCAKPTKRTLLSYFSFLRYIAAKFFLTNSFFAFFFFSSSSLQFFSYFLVAWYSSYTLHASFYEIISTKTASISFMHIWVRVRL